VKIILLGTLAIMSASAFVPAASQVLTPWGCEENDGAPFGQTGDKGEDELKAFAQSNGLELEPTLAKANSGDKKALERILGLSIQFHRLDGSARTYGNVVYSIFLSLGEQKNNGFMSALSVQDKSVKQRIRDILWHPLLCLPADQRVAGERATREAIPRVWPPEYSFGLDDSVFGQVPNRELRPRSASQ
jgi:hypothetical protein